MTTRTITGTLHRADDSAWVGARIKFSLADDTFTTSPAITYPLDAVTAVTDTTGAFSVALASGLGVYWNVSMPWGEAFQVAVPAGATTTLEALRAAAAGIPAPIDIAETVTDLTVTNDLLVGGSVTGPLIDAGGQVFNVLAYGAAGDGVTDDGTAIAAAITAASAVGGGIVYFPPGTYSTDDGIGWSADNIHLLGAGRGASIITIASGGTHPIEFSGTGSSVRQLEIDGNAAGGGGGHGIRLNGTNHIVSDCYIHDADGYGIGAGQQAGETLQNCHFSNLLIRDSATDGFDSKNQLGTNRTNTMTGVIIDGFDLNVDGGQAGIDLRGPWTVSNVEVRGISANGAGVRFRAPGATDGGEDSSLSGAVIYGTGGGGSYKGIQIACDRVQISNVYVADCDRGIARAGTGAKVSNVHITDSGVDGIEVEGARWTISNARIQTAVTTGIDVRANDCTIIGATIDTTTTDGIHVVGVDRTWIVGCKFTGTTGDAIDIDASSDNTHIAHCDFSQWSGTVLTDGGATTVLQGNLGLVDDSAEATVYLASDGSAIGAAIADFFGATKAANLPATTRWELEGDLYFLKSTAGTVTLTITNSAANWTSFSGRYVMSPVGGVGAVGTPQTAGIVNTTTSAAAFPASGSLTDATVHVMGVRATFQMNAAGNVRVRMTESAGTITPQADSYLTLRRIPNADAGDLVA